MVLIKFSFQMGWLIVFAGVILILSCVGIKPNTGKLNQCVRSKTDDTFKIVYGKKTDMNVYRMTNIIEDELVSLGVVKKIDKGAYLKILDEIFLKQNDIIIQNEVCREYSNIAGLIVLQIVSDCPYEVIIKEKNRLESPLVYQLQSASNLISSGYDYSTISEYIEGLEEKYFEMVEFRAPIMVMLLFKLESIHHKD